MLNGYLLDLTLYLNIIRKSFTRSLRDDSGILCVFLSISYYLHGDKVFIFYQVFLKRNIYRTKCWRTFCFGFLIMYLLKMMWCHFIPFSCTPRQMTEHFLHIFSRWVFLNRWRFITWLEIPQLWFASHINLYFFLPLCATQIIV